MRGSAAVLSWITETLAVGGSFPTERAAELAPVYRLSAVVDLRAECCDDRAALSRCGLAFLHLPTLDQHAIVPEMLDRGMAFVRSHLTQGGCVLVHCEHGIGRSALLALCILVDQGWAPLDALRTVKAKRAVISPSPAQYEAWAEWLSRCGQPPPPFETFAAIAYDGVAA